MKLTERDLKLAGIKVLKEDEDDSRTIESIEEFEKLPEVGEGKGLEILAWWKATEEAEGGFDIEAHTDMYLNGVVGIKDNPEEHLGFTIEEFNDFMSWAIR